MTTNLRLVGLLTVAVIMAANSVLAQPQREPDRPLILDARPPSAQAQIPPLSDDQVRAELRQRLGREIFAFNGPAVRLTVRNPYDERSGAGLLIDGARSVAPVFNTAMMGSGGETGGVITVRQPEGSSRFNMFDCSLSGPQSIQWRGRREGSGAVEVTNDHAVFVVPATPDNWIRFYSESPSGWNFQGCQIRAID